MNAILRGHYSLTNVRRETATVTEFRIHPLPQEPTKNGKRKAAELPSVQLTDTLDSVNKIHGGLQVANATSRSNKDLKNLDETLCVKHLTIKGFDNLRSDTTLSFIDIPGLNDYGLGPVSKDWAQRNWKTFDCAIVVLDAQDGFNTQEPVALIDDIHRLLEEDRKMPVIFLANKYDDCDNPYWSQNIKEIESKLEGKFGVCGLQSKVEKFLNAKNSGKPRDFPEIAFLPCSAQYALIYLSTLCEGFTLEHFKKLPFEVIDRFGNSDVGNKKWRLLKTKEEKYQRAFKELEDQSSCKLGLKDTNFDKVIMIIDSCVAGKEEQAQLICHQLDYELTSKQHTIDNVVLNLRLIHDKKKIVLGDPTKGIKEFLWENYNRFENEAFAKLKGPKDCSELSRLMQLLEAYNKFATEVQLHSEHCVVSEKQANLVRRQIKLIIDKANFACSSIVPSSPRHQRIAVFSWESMSLRDWFDLIDSILSVQQPSKAAEDFAHELRELRYVYHSVHDKSKLKATAASLDIPHSFDDSNHWGHLLYLYCAYLVKKKPAGRILQN